MSYVINERSLASNSSNRFHALGSGCNVLEPIHPELPRFLSIKHTSVHLPKQNRQLKVMAEAIQRRRSFHSNGVDFFTKIARASGRSVPLAENLQDVGLTQEGDDLCEKERSEVQGYGF